MVNIKKIWIFPLLGGIIALIGLLTPTAYLTLSFGLVEFNEYDWMWGLVYSELLDYEFFDFDYSFEFNIFAPGIFTLGLVISILILVIAILSMTTAIKFKRLNGYFLEVKKSWIITGILYFAFTIFYIIGMEIGFNLYRLRTMGMPVSFWEDRIPHFGIIAPFISGALVVVGVILGVQIQKREEVIKPIGQVGIKPKVISSPEVNLPSKVVSSPGISTFHFCPECGHKNIVEGSRFCVNCGAAFNP
jgi:hypothetical protein